MTDLPAIFSGPMVRAMLDGRKTQTRRLANSPLRRAQAGDRLWVRETWATHWANDDLPPREIAPSLWTVLYLAEGYRRPAAKDGSVALASQCKKVRPAIHMPRWASRLTLLVSRVWVEPLQAISNADAIAEGVERNDPRVGGWRDYQGQLTSAMSARESYASLWMKLHGRDSWKSNPDVVAIEFAVREGNVDQLA